MHNIAEINYKTLLKILQVSKKVENEKKGVLSLEKINVPSLFVSRKEEERNFLFPGKFSFFADSYEIVNHILFD